MRIMDVSCFWRGVVDGGWRFLCFLFHHEEASSIWQPLHLVFESSYYGVDPDRGSQDQVPFEHFGFEK